MSTVLALSEDIIIGHVLTRLPVKSLRRCKCVCKSWLHILSNPDPHFVTTHVTHTSRNPDHECLIMSMYKYSRSRRRYNYGLRYNYALRNRLWVEILSRSRLSYTSINHAPEHSRIIGSINGLICLTFKCLFLLWNPATGLIKTIVPPQPYHGNKNFIITLYGFGWDCGEGEFKVVVCYGDQKSLQGVVYTSNPDSWNGLDIPDTFSGKTIKGNTATIVQGCPYWTATSGYDKFVLKFESGSSQFKDFLIPFQVIRTYSEYKLVNVKDCLAMMVYLQMSGTVVDVFHLDEEYGVWSKTYTFGPIHCYMADFSQCFKYGGEVVFNFAKLLYDPKTNGVKVIGDDHWILVSGYSYTPSLVFLPGMEPLHTRSHWTSSTDIESSMSEPAQIPLRLVFKLVFSRLLKCFGWD